MLELEGKLRKSERDQTGELLWFFTVSDLVGTYISSCPQREKARPFGLRVG